MKAASNINKHMARLRDFMIELGYSFCFIVSQFEIGYSVFCLTVPLEEGWGEGKIKGEAQCTH
jgi:hypothetical protein